MWLVQAMGVDVTNGNKIMEVLKAKGIPYAPVGVKPFSTEITGLDDVELEQGKALVYGSTKLVKLTKELGLTPGAFFDPSTFNMMVWKDKYDYDHGGPGFLNDECEFKLIGELAGPLKHRRFVRPVMDLKTFGGSIVEAGDTWEDFFSTTFKDPNYDKNIMVAVGRTWPIYEEYRFFVVNRKIVTGSLYRSRGELTPSAQIPVEIQEEADRIVSSYWLPHDHCVIDLARTDGGVELIEFNCINASGLYEADVEKLVDALNSLMV